LWVKVHCYDIISSSTYVISSNYPKIAHGYEENSAEKEKSFYTALKFFYTSHFIKLWTFIPARSSSVWGEKNTHHRHSIFATKLIQIHSTLRIKVNVRKNKMAPNIIHPCFPHNMVIFGVVSDGMRSKSCRIV
jgi:hypothetical protein